ncbi:MAG: tetratricopeptide repeat protein [Clostridia bacterium]|nr:tetratricopeptide repeat protein [Clostridia bacterium]
MENMQQNHTAPVAGETVPVSRFLARLDGCFGRNDMSGARECIRFWEEEARRMNDRRGLLTVLNEAVGFYRRTQKKSKAMAALRECLELLDELGQANTLSGATVIINAATTLSFFGQPAESLPLYAQAAECYEAQGRTDSYEYAALLNNQAAAYEALKQYDDAERCWREAVEILRREGKHDGEIAISLVCLAHLTFDRDDTAFEQVEQLLDEAWDCLNSPRQPRDGNYAYILRKCAPSFDYFQRPDAAQALREVAKEIYGQ